MAYLGEDLVISVMSLVWLLHLKILIVKQVIKVLNMIAAVIHGFDW